ncbi:MAG: ImmA/IrrE family metallo-endopeptidase [Synechococcaceae cyanobacterium SM2_3_2]|nr:ImmA/IrrE family metallo-endopeptidase [Synechococcaceae cyanobacterium SM2_3_2]
MPSVNSIRVYREQSGLSQADLGLRLDVTRQTIAAWEKGDREPSVAQLFRIAQALGIGVDLLLAQPLSDTKDPADAVALALPSSNGEGLLFRADDPDAIDSHLRASLAQKSSNYAFVERLVREVPTLPEMRPLEGYDPEFVEEVAHEIRDWLGSGESNPVGDVLAILESKGLKTILTPLPGAVSGFSAFTETSGATIFVNARHPTERQFFTALHELAHLIFHRHEYRQPSPKAKRGDPREKVANHFAGAVLLPQEVIQRELRAYRNRWVPEPLLIDIKQRYRVSMRTVLYRAEQGGLISVKLKGQQLGQLNKKYGPDSEPGEILPAQHLTRLERLVYLALLREELTTSRAAEILGKSFADVRHTLSQWLEDADP